MKRLTIPGLIITFLIGSCTQEIKSTSEGNKYEESIMLHHSAPNLEGTTIKIFMEVSMDTLIQRWSTDGNWILQEN